MDELLKTLLDRLGQAGEIHEEIYDTECRDRMSNAIFDGFIRHRSDFILPSDFGLYSTGANAVVRDALAEYIDGANARATGLRLNSFHERLSAFQDGGVKSDRGDYFDDLFGYSSPDAFDANGEMIDEP